jgi:hypothetical protein
MPADFHFRSMLVFPAACRVCYIGARRGPTTTTVFCTCLVHWCTKHLNRGISQNPDFIPTAALREKFLAYISSICGAAKFFPRLAFGRTPDF